MCASDTRPAAREAKESSITISTKKANTIRKAVGTRSDRPSTELLVTSPTRRAIKGDAPIQLPNQAEHLPAPGKQNSNSNLRLLYLSAPSSGEDTNGSLLQSTTFPINEALLRSFALLGSASPTSRHSTTDLFNRLLLRVPIVLPVPHAPPRTHNLHTGWQLVSHCCCFWPC